MMTDDLVLPSICAAFALILTFITNELFIPSEKLKAERWWHFCSSALIVLVKFLFLTLFFVIAMHRILLAMAILTILFLLIFSRPNV